MSEVLTDNEKHYFYATVKFDIIDIGLLS